MGVTFWSFHVRKTNMLDRSSKLPITGDPLTDILRGLRLEGVRHGRCEMKEPWGIEFPAQEAAHFHFIGRKDCWLKQPDGEWVELKAGDAVLLPGGAAHVLAAEPQALTWPITGYEVSELCRNVFCLSNDGCRPGTLLFSGVMYFNLDNLHPLLGMMPDVMRTRGLATDDPGIAHLLDAMAREVTMERVGAGGIMARLADVLAATIIRSWVESGCGDSTGWIAAVRDRDIGRVLAAIHLEPHRDWTVEALARMMGASRSGFAERFSSIVGQPPLKYVTTIRMYQAKRWLIRDHTKISVVASRLGYESEAAFSRAFKRVVGAPPSHFRNNKTETTGKA